LYGKKNILIIEVT